MMKKVYVIEDQTILRQLVCRLVEELPECELAGQSGDGLEGYDACREIKPDLVIVDIMVPSLNGLEIVRQLRKDLPRVKLIIFSAYSSRERVQSAMKAGVNGIIHKNASIDELEEGIKRVLNNESFMSSQILETLRDLMLNPHVTDSMEKLTTRERELLQLIAEGNTTKEIAAKLNISVKTADTHRTNVMNKLDIHDIAGLTRFAIQNGIVEA
ncbi:response regulator transcription factor [Puniceicoccales bacterium CK1056]|uniref:Response regulator transcription factor n=1 Tax=Oceanipulchritudo coccoides TaxID=2706888 RepID=A0A6B2M290_9BACT|nr:response regulator transcription factor [Oceanipulchritudo coccoides]NDV62254.1 response regulator transcription factor [Oceanipulchritudo coccoides]